MQDTVSSVSAKSVSAFGKARRPLTEASLEAAWKAQQRAGHTFKKAVDKFKTEMERIARPASSSEEFPKRVVYEPCCGEQCRHFADCERVVFHCHLQKALHQCICRHGSVMDAVRADIICAFEVADKSGHIETLIASLTAPSYRSSTHPPSCALAHWRVVKTLASEPGPDPRCRFDGLLLELCTLPFEPQTLGHERLPRQPLEVGSVKFSTSDSFWTC